MLVDALLCRLDTNRFQVQGYDDDHIWHTDSRKPLNQRYQKDYATNHSEYHGKMVDKKSIPRKSPVVDFTKRRSNNKLTAPTLLGKKLGVPKR